MNRAERLRRAAILVASLDEALAERLLRDLGPQEAAQVLAELERLDEIDVEEQEDVLDEFRRMTRASAPSPGAVEFTYSAPAPALAPQEAPPTSSSHDADVATMGELLSREQPQIIAAALSRLGGDLGAAVFAALPADLHAEVLDRVSQLAPADEEAVLEVESQLLQKVGERRAHRERVAAGAELAQRLIAKTAPAQRVVLLERLSLKRTPASRMPALRTPPAPTHHESHRAPQHESQQARILATAVERARRADYFEAPTPPHRQPEPPQAADPVRVLEDQSRALEALSDEALLAALRAVDQQTVMRALAASSERLIKRITRRLPWRQARSLRRSVRSVGPTRLTELREAQHQLLKTARDSAAVGAAA